MNDDLYKTDQTPLAAFLITEGYSLLDIIFVGTKAFFVFSNNDPTFLALVKDFELLRAQTNAAQLISNFKDLIPRTKRGANG